MRRFAGRQRGGAVVRATSQESPVDFSQHCTACSSWTLDAHACLCCKRLAHCLAICVAFAAAGNCAIELGPIAHACVLSPAAVFFHDPDNMIEICNCDCLPIRPLESDSCPVSAAASRQKAVPPRPHAQCVRRAATVSTAHLSREVERAVAKLKRADSPDSPLPTDLMRALTS